nr:NAD-dependent protein deacetylase sirtuin-1 [Polyrhizophydium stewartii]
MLDDARLMGFRPWLDQYQHLGVANLFQVFDVDLPLHLHMAPRDHLVPLLRAVMEDKIVRKKRPDINSLDDVLRLLDSCSNIMVLTGAGCSVSCGIPDFRSKNGIYSRLDEFDLEDPQQMFDINYFRARPETFFSFAREIYPSNFVPSPSHMFIKLLEQKGKLLRNYTQNIDTLERAAGINRVVQCHGSFATATCIVCGYHVPGSAIEPDIQKKSVPRCPRCHEDRDGILKPDIVFFGEKLPDEFERFFLEDMRRVDLLIVMGSSLKVSPVADVKDRIPHDVPQILINLEALPSMSNFDVQLLGYCDSIVAELCRHLGWSIPPPPPALAQSNCAAGLPKPMSLPADAARSPPPLESADAVSPQSHASEDHQAGSTRKPLDPPAPAFRQGSLPHRLLFEGAVESSHSGYDDDDYDDDDSFASGSACSSDSESNSDLDSASGREPFSQSSPPRSRSRSSFSAPSASDRATSELDFDTDDNIGDHHRHNHDDDDDDDDDRLDVFYSVAVSSAATGPYYTAAASLTDADLARGCREPPVPVRLIIDNDGNGDSSDDVYDDVFGDDFDDDLDCTPAPAGVNSIAASDCFSRICSDGGGSPGSSTAACTTALGALGALDPLHPDLCSDADREIDGFGRIARDGMLISQLPTSPRVHE